MNGPVMLEPRMVAEDTFSLPSFLPIPDHGVLPVNAFLIKGSEPVLVDTGLPMLGDQFMAAVEKVIDPSDIRWIWLSHTDADHLGSLRAVLARAPNAEIVLHNFAGMGKLRLLGHDVSRVRMLEPGTSLQAGEHTLVPFRPPVYDAPETMGFVDTRTNVVFSADAFGALLEEPTDHIGAVRPDALKHGMSTWAAIDAPWLGNVRQSIFGGNLDRIARLDPAAIISGHLPQADGMTATLLKNLSDIQAAGPTDGPDHELLDRLVAELPVPADRKVA